MLPNGCSGAHQPDWASNMAHASVSKMQMFVLENSGGRRPTVEPTLSPDLRSCVIEVSAGAYWRPANTIFAPLCKCLLSPLYRCATVPPARAPAHVVAWCSSKLMVAPCCSAHLSADHAGALCSSLMDGRHGRGGICLQPGGCGAIAVLRAGPCCLFSARCKAMHQGRAWQAACKTANEFKRIPGNRMCSH